jgi:simple sugar transport system permease protein
MGYLALAILIAGGWNIGGIITFGIIFAVFIASANTTTLVQLGINQLFVFALPYIITLIILLFTSNKITPPASAGQPFISEVKE